MRRCQRQRRDNLPLPPHPPPHTHFALVMDGLKERLLCIRSGPFFSTIWQKPPLTPASTNHCLFALSSAEGKNVPVSSGFNVPQRKLYSLYYVVRLAANIHCLVVCGTERDKRKATKAEVPSSFLFFFILNLARTKERNSQDKAN